MFRWFLLTVILLSGCSDAPPSRPVDGSPRIISLSPAITRTLEDAGLSGHLVGRSAWCRLRDGGDVPVVGDLHERDWEAIVKLQPTHVFFQSEDVNTDGAMVDLAKVNGWTLRAWPLRTMGEVSEMLIDLPAAFPTLESEATLGARCRRLSEAVDAAIVPGREPVVRRVLLVSDGVPPLAWGERTYLGELLIGAGATNVIGDSGWKTISLEEVVRVAPEVIIVISEQADSSPPAIAELEIPAVTDGHVHRLIHEDINLPGPHLVGLSQTLRELVTRP